MGVFTFVLRKSGADWTAKQFSGDIEESSPSTYEIQRKLVKAALDADSSGAVQSSYSLISPSSAVFQVLILHLYPSTPSINIFWIPHLFVFSFDPFDYSY